mgnify:CR=1 FL=1
MTESKRNLTPHFGQVDRNERDALLGQKGAVIWLTGLSGSGKSTLAYALERRLVDAGRAAFVLDGDNVRHGLNADLGFAPEDRQENIRRVGEVAALMAEAGLLVLVSFISPYRSDRQAVRDKLPPGRFIEVFVGAPVEVCEERDPKGLYVKARTGALAEFTGVSAPYEAPEKAELRVDTARLDLGAALGALWSHLVERGLLKRDGGSK